MERFQENKVIEKSLFFLCRRMANGAELCERITLSGPDVPWQRGTRLDSGFSTLVTIAPTPWPSGLLPSSSRSKSSFSDAFTQGDDQFQCRKLFGQTEGMFDSCCKITIVQQSGTFCSEKCEIISISISLYSTTKILLLLLLPIIIIRRRRKHFLCKIR